MVIFNKNILSLVCGSIIFASNIVCQDFKPINWSQITKDERKYSYPAYVEVASSQCDLTENMCDISCCSDVDCSQEQKSVFQCLGGLVDGEKTESLIDWMCGDHYLDSGYFWSPLLCLVLKNTPYLGEYYVTREKIESLSKLHSVLNLKKDFHLQSEGDNVDNGTDRYTYGVPVRTRFITVKDVVDSVDNLQLPRQLGGSLWCSDASPVRFLQSTMSNCLRKISADECRRGWDSMLSAVNYVVVDTLTNVAQDVNHLPMVAKDIFGQNSTNTTLRYLCFNNGTRYLRFSDIIFEPFLDDDEDFITNNISLDCSLPASELMSTFYNETTEVCENVVISVLYEFLWNSSSLPQLNVTYVLADLPVSLKSYLLSTNKQYKKIVPLHKRTERNTPELYMIQKFTTTFTSVERELVNGSKNNMTGLWKRSGNPGYEFNLPLLAWAVNPENESDVLLQPAMLGVWGRGELEPNNISRTCNSSHSLTVVLHTHNLVVLPLTQPIYYRSTLCCSVFPTIPIMLIDRC